MSGLHVGITPDGNRRYARLNGKTYAQACSEGLARCKDIVRTVIDGKEREKYPELERVSCLTVYLCSKANLLRRPPDQVALIFDTCRELLRSYVQLADEHRLKLRFIGDLTLFPDDLQAGFREAAERTERHSEYQLNLACGYDGREHLSGGTGSLAERMSELRDIDLVIRTGREKRTSGFFPWQTMYSEWFFSDKLWPEFTVDDFIRALKDYDGRERRFGA